MAVWLTHLCVRCVPSHVGVVTVGSYRYKLHVKWLFFGGETGSDVGNLGPDQEPPSCNAWCLIHRVHLSGLGLSGVTHATKV